MGDMDEDRIVPGCVDPSGQEVLTVYSIVPGRYTVYGTGTRVAVQFSTVTEDALLRSRVTKLAAICGQINGVLSEWRYSSDPEERARALNSDARVAAALSIALEGDPVQAEELLIRTHFDILEERAAVASVSYVLWAAAATAVAIVLACVFTWSRYRLVFDFSPEGKALWLGVGAGALGAFFSTAVSARNRAIRTNIQRRRENRMDAILRIAIGAIAGMLLAGLLHADLITFSVGGIGTDADSKWMVVSFGAFAAGFSERLIPNLLERSASASSTSDASDEASRATLRSRNVTVGRSLGTASLETSSRPRESDHRRAEGDLPQQADRSAGAAGQADLHRTILDSPQHVECSNDRVTDDPEPPPRRGRKKR